MRRILITGGTGFLGSYLSEFLSSQGDEVTATYVVNPDPFLAHKAGAAKSVHLDVTDASEVVRLLNQTRPETIFHFAGQPYVKPSWADPMATFRTNIDGTLVFLEWIRQHAPKTRFAFAGSGAAYGVSEKQPIDEETPLRPTSPYASSKAVGDLLCYQYHASFGVPTYRFRIFGTTGPGKVGDAANDFASQVARLESKEPPRTIKVGRTDTLRDVTDVRDSVRAMALIVDRGTPGEAYNIGSGEARSVQGILEAFCRLARNPIEVETDASRLRQVDEPVIQADTRKLRSLGWTPSIPWSQTLDDILNHWRSKIDSSATV